jgi:hypothetical protein
MSALRVNTREPPVRVAPQKEGGDTTEASINAGLIQSAGPPDDRGGTGI